MQLDFSPITNSPLYKKELGTLKTTGKQKLWVIAVMVILPPLWIPLIIYALIKIPEAFRRHKIRQQAIVEFAQKNGFSYQAVPYVKSAGKGLADKTPDLPYQVDAVYGSGHMTGTLHGMNFEYICGGFVLPLPNYRSATGGKSSSDTKYICSLSVELPVSFPKLFIDSKRNNITGFEIRPDAFVNMQEYSLEGEFPKFYRVLAEKNDQINVLSILTPEVMHKLLTKNYYDIWLNGNKLVVFAHATEIEYFVGIPEIFTTADLALNEIDKIARDLQKNS